MIAEYGDLSDGPEKLNPTSAFENEFALACQRVDP